MLSTNKIRTRFPIYRTTKNLIYLDTAASALKLDCAIKAQDDYYRLNGTNIHRGVYNLSFIATSEYEKAREVVAKFINANSNEVVFTKGTTDSLNRVSRMLCELINEGDEIISSELEHHSSILPWIEIAKRKKAIVKYIPLTKDGKITITNFKKVLTSRTKVVAITHVSNVTGDETPLKEIAQLAKENNAFVIVDSAQAVLHSKVDVKDLGIDFLAFSGHKIYGPSGIGVLYGKEKLINELDPGEYGGEMVNHVSFDNATYKDAPLRLEAGTQNIAGALGLAKSIEYIDSIGIYEISRHSAFLKKYTLKQMKEIDGIVIHNVKSNGSIIVFNVIGIHPHDAATFLDQEGVCVRAGHHCAQLINNFYGVDATIRASFSIYNNKKDCDLFIEALKKCVDFFKQF